jgi:hypothetical protein
MDGVGNHPMIHHGATEVNPGMNLGSIGIVPYPSGSAQPTEKVVDSEQLGFRQASMILSGVIGYSLILLPVAL